MNLSPAKTKNDLSKADQDLAALKSSLAARKAAIQTINSPARLSLVGTGQTNIAQDQNQKMITRNAITTSSIDSTEALSKSQPDLFTGIEQR